MTLAVVPFNRASVAPRQVEYVTEAMSSGQLSGDGPFTKRASDHLSALHDGAQVLLTTSCTAALELSALLLEIEPGDEVIVPSFTFVSGAAAFALMGAKLVFADADPESLNLDLEQVRKLITDRTRAIAPVHYGGRPAVGEAFVAEMRERGVMVIEDNAHGLFGHHDGRPLGTLGSISTLSFHETKNVTCGEGGALIINDHELLDRAEIIREKGTNRSRFFRGMVDKYTWVALGSSYLCSDVNAAMLLAQLEHAQPMQRRRAEIWQRFNAELSPWALPNGVAMPSPHDGQSFHLFDMLLPRLDERVRFLAHMKDRGVTATFHYLPLHLSPAGERHGSAPLGCPRTVEVSDRLVRLPLFADLRDDEVERIISATLEFES